MGPDYNREHAIAKDDATVLLKFNNNDDPALLYWRYGEGYVIEWTLECIGQFFENNDLDTIMYRTIKHITTGPMPPPTPSPSNDLFKVTVGKYSGTADLDQVIKNEFGNDYRLADWNDVLAYSDDIQNWASSIGMEHGDSYLISRDGNRFWSGRRHYFMTRHDHNCPGSFLVHDDIDNHLIDLGSWYDLEMHVLCIKTTTPTPPPSVSLGEAVDNTDLSWTSGGDADWFGQTSTYYYDGDAAQSGNISDNQVTWRSTSVNGPQTVSFYWKVDSESDYDYLRFYIDGVQQDSISGSTSWEQKTYYLGLGSHTLKWSYTKDGSVSTGEDCGWVDKLEFIPGIIPVTAPLFYVGRPATSSEAAYTELIWHPSGINNYYGYEVHLSNPTLTVSVSNDYKIGYFAPITLIGPQAEDIAGNLIIWGGVTLIDRVALGGIGSFLLELYNAFRDEDNAVRGVDKVEVNGFLSEEILIDHVNLFVDSNNEARYLIQIVSDTPTQNWQIYVSGSIDYDYMWDPSYQGTSMTPPSMHGTLSYDRVITLNENPL